MATRKGDMRGGSRQCDQCGKTFTSDKEEDEAKLRFSTEETNRFIDEEGFFSCKKHRRDQMCNDCFHTEVAIDNERRAFGRDLGRAVKRIWKELYIKEGVKAPWSEDEDEDDEAPSDNVQQQTGKASSSHSGEKTCAHCGKGGNLNRCAKCKVTFYCSRSHQAADYAKHKADCQTPKALVNDMAQEIKTRHDEKPCDAPDNSEQPPSSTWLICAHCGIKGDKLSRCARCKCTWYCCAEHQRAHYPEHKLECKMIADTAKAYARLGPSESTDMFHPHIWANKTVCLMNLKNEDTIPKEYRVISWRELERMHPNVATGRTLEIRIVSLEPSGFWKQDYVGRDAEGSELEIAFRTCSPPDGLRKGCVIRWRNPWSHHFAYGGSGVNIEHWDLPNVSVCDG